MSITLEQLERAARLAANPSAVAGEVPPPVNGDVWDRVEALLSGRAPAKASETPAPALASADPIGGTQPDLFYLRLPMKVAANTPIYDGGRAVGHVLGDDSERAVIFTERLSEAGRARAAAIVKAVGAGRCEVKANGTHVALTVLQ